MDWKLPTFASILECPDVQLFPGYELTMRFQWGGIRTFRWRCPMHIHLRDRLKILQSALRQGAQRNEDDKLLRNITIWITRNLHPRGPPTNAQLQANDLPDDTPVLTAAN